MLAKHALSQLSYAPVPENTKLDDRIGWLAEPKLALPRSAYAQDGLRRDSLGSLARAKAGGPGKT